MRLPYHPRDLNGEPDVAGGHLFALFVGSLPSTAKRALRTESAFAWPPDGSDYGGDRISPAEALSVK